MPGAAALPAPARLRPGIGVLVRETGVVQVGLDAPRRVLLPDVREVRTLLDTLAHGGGAATAPDPHGPAGRALDALDRAGLLVAAADLRDVEPALLARHGHGGRARLAGRGSARVHLDVAPRLRSETRRLLAAAGLTPTGEEDGERPAVALVAADRVLDRSRTDAWLRDGVAHLCLEARDGGLVVGPLVVPGATACLRCVDAHRAEHDPLRATVLERAAARPDPSPYDGLGASLALSWAVRDLRLLVEGERPPTWSATVEIDTADADPALAPRRWLRHPCCGCGWDVRLG